MSEPSFDAADSSRSTDEQSAGTSQSLVRSVSLSRQCWVCYATEADEPNVEWLHPCRCIGSTMWVHDLCLQRWIDTKQRGDTFREVKCPQCDVCYRIVYPRMNSLALALERLRGCLSVASGVATLGCVVCTVQAGAYLHGRMTLSLVLDREATTLFRYVDCSHALVFRWFHLVLVPTVPVVLLMCHRIRWQEPIFTFLNRYVLPPIRSKSGRDYNVALDQLPSQHDAAQPQDNAHDNPNMPEEVPAAQPAEAPVAAAVPVNLQIIFNGMSITNYIASSLCLPVIARIHGDVFFSDIIRTPWRRCLAGGALYLAAKAVAQMYYRRQMLLRIANRKINSYPTMVTKESQTERDREVEELPSPAEVDEIREILQNFSNEISEGLVEHDSDAEWETDHEYDSDGDGSQGRNDSSTQTMAFR